MGDPPILQTLQNLPGRARIRANGWHNTNCPNTAGHPNNDRNASFGWKQGVDDNVLIKCFSGCTPEEIVTALGHQMRDLFVPANGADRTYFAQRVYVYTDTAGKKTLKTRLDYRKADGTTDKETRWDPGATASEVLWYRSEALTDPAKDGFVYIVEGEADCDALTDVLRDSNRVAIAAPSASYDPPQQAIDALSDRIVVLWPDLDDAGHALMRRIAPRLTEIAPVWIAQPDRDSLPDGAGAADWVASLTTAEGEASERAPEDLLDAMTVNADPGPRQKPQPAVKIGTRTVADLPFGDPPPQVVPPFLDPEEPTVIYGPGGTGKGHVASWLALEARRAGHVVMLLDFESHLREWGGRIRNLGATDDEMAGIHWRSPWAPDWEEKRGLLKDVDLLVRADCDRLGVTLLIVDSYLPAAGAAEAMGGQAGAIEYFAALARIGRPSLTIAHVSGDGVRFHDKPYGSIFVHNLARETWAVEQVVLPETPGPLISFAPTVLALELRNKKRAVGVRTPPQFVTFSFLADGHIEYDHRDTPVAGVKRQAADLAAEVLTGAPKALTYEQIAAAILSSTGEVVGLPALRAAFSRAKGRERFEAAGKTTAGKELWRLKP